MPSPRYENESAKNDESFLDEKGTSSTKETDDGDATKGVGNKWELLHRSQHEPPHRTADVRPDVRDKGGELNPIHVAMTRRDYSQAGLITNVHEAIPSALKDAGGNPSTGFISF